MPKNKIGGSKHKKAKNYIESNSIRYKENHENYGKVVKILGNCRFMVLCDDGLERLSIMRGKFKKRKFINLHDIVLVEIWDFQDEKSSIIHVYSEDNIRKLKKSDNFPKTFCEEEETNISDDYSSFDLIDCDSDIEEGVEEKQEKEEENSDKKDDGEIDLDEI